MGHAPQDWAIIQEPMHRPLWEAILDAALVRPGIRILDTDTKTLKSALRVTFEAFRLNDGAILIQPHVFKYVIAQLKIGGEI